MSTEQITKLQADLDAANAALAAERAAKAAATRQAHETAAAEFAEGLVKANKLMPADRDLVVATLVALEADAPVEFGEGDAKKPVGAALRELLGKLPANRLDDKHIATGGHVKAVALDDPQAIANAAVEFQEAEAKAGRQVSTHQAVQHIVNTQGAHS